MFVNCINNIIQENAFSYTVELSTIVLQPLYMFDFQYIWGARSILYDGINWIQNADLIYKIEVLLNFWSDIYPQLPYSINSHHICNIILTLTIGSENAVAIPSNQSIGLTPNLLSFLLI